MHQSPHIAVIGAGVAGLSCAAALRLAGAEVSVFDKSRGPAGRMSTKRGENWHCDHGAQYFTARHPDFRAEVARWIEAGVAALWAPRLQVLGDASLHAPDAALERYVGLPRMTAPARLMAESLALKPQTTLRQIERREQRWHLRSAEHGWLDQQFDALVLAVPAPQAVPLLQQPAPELATLAAGANMRGCWALMLRFAGPVDLPFDAAFVNDGPLRWIARDSSKPGRGGPETWLLHAGAQWSEAHLEQDADSVAAELLRAFGELGGPTPQAWAVHRWRYADTEPAFDQGCAWQGDHALGLCGDWLNGGKVEGAWRSGRLLARQVVQSFVPR
jgi:predicted NAD/FAD-dependent oxidoreductase